MEMYNYHLIWNGADVGLCSLRYHKKGYLFDSFHGGSIVIPFACILSEYRKMESKNVIYFEIKTE